MLKPVFRIRRICKFLGLQDPDPLIICTDPYPDLDLSVNKPKNFENTLISTIFYDC
jgi:hypothetical protein